jgi:hypothetical protein
LLRQDLQQSWHTTAVTEDSAAREVSPCWGLVSRFTTETTGNCNAPNSGSRGLGLFSASATGNHLCATSDAIVYLNVSVNSVTHDLLSEASLTSILRYRDAPGHVNALLPLSLVPSNSDQPHPCHQPFAIAKCGGAEPLKVEAVRQLITP